MFKYPEFSDELYGLACECEEELSYKFKEIDDISEENQYKVINAFRNNRVSESDFNSASGYGYNETGRDKLEAVYAEIFHTEDALVRNQITCGTHAIYLALSANLLPGDELLYISGKPYDSLESSIMGGPLSLAEYGVSFNYVELLEERDFDKEGIRQAVNSRTKIAAIQRSKGYSLRDSMSVSRIGEIAEFIHEIDESIIVFVDNCYGEFVEISEPTDVGADLMAGSLIKNPGGGLAPSGGYIAGNAKLVKRCAYKLTAPGLGKEVGISGGVLKSFYQGLSLSPKIVANAVKTAHFLAALFEKSGFEAYPASFEDHACIVEAIKLNTPENVIKFCTAVQKASYVDSYLSPEGWDMPGYNDSIIMASGAFISGSSIELSADGPLREPYAVYFQGGLTFEHGKYAALSALNAVIQD